MSQTKHPKKTSQQFDWHSAYIIAALRVAGFSLRGLSVRHGYGATTLANAIHSPWPKGERIIADAIGEKPYNIWPSRYGEDNKPLSGHGQRKALGTGRHVKRNGNTVKARCNVQGETEN